MTLTDEQVKEFTDYIIREPGTGPKPFVENTKLGKVRSKIFFYDTYSKYWTLKDWCKDCLEAIYHDGIDPFAPKIISLGLSLLSLADQLLANPECVEKLAKAYNNYKLLYLTPIMDIFEKNCTPDVGKEYYYSRAGRPLALNDWAVRVFAMLIREKYYKDYAITAEEKSIYAALIEYPKFKASFEALYEASKELAIKENKLFRFIKVISGGPNLITVSTQAVAEDELKEALAILNEYTDEELQKHNIYGYAAADTTTGTIIDYYIVRKILKSELHGKTVFGTTKTKTITRKDISSLLDTALEGVIDG